MPEWTADGRLKLKLDAKRVSQPCCPQGQRETGLGNAAPERNGFTSVVSLLPLRVDGKVISMNDKVLLTGPLSKLLVHSLVVSSRE